MLRMNICLRMALAMDDTTPTLQPSNSLGEVFAHLEGWPRSRGKSVDFTGYWQRHIDLSARRLSSVLACFNP
jgi:hypothetical protein